MSFHPSPADISKYFTTHKGVHVCCKIYNKAYCHFVTIS